MLSVIPSGIFGSNFTRKIAKTLIINNESNVLSINDLINGMASLFILKSAIFFLAGNEIIPNTLNNANEVIVRYESSLKFGMSEVNARIENRKYPSIKSF